MFMWNKIVRQNSCYSIIFPFQIIIYEIKYNKYIKTYRQLKKLLQQSNYLKDVLDGNIHQEYRRT